MKKAALLIFIFVAVFVSTSAQDHKVKWANFDGNKIRYYDIGPKKKDALVFIHGWTCNADFWKASLDAFPEYRVIALDLIGHGQSDKPKTDYTMEYFARSVDSVLKDAGVKRAVLVGHSMGTPVARQYYRLYPGKAAGIVIVDGALKRFFPPDAAQQILAQLQAKYKETSGQFVEGMIAPIKDESIKKFIRENMGSTPEYVAISAWQGMADEKIWVDDKVNVPVLAVMAPGPFWPADVEPIFKSVAPNIDFQMWQGVTHILMMEKPKEFNAVVKAYVEKNKLL